MNSLMLRVINHPAAFHEAAAEHAIPAPVQLLPVTHDIPAIIRFVRHHDHRRVALHAVEAADDGAAEAVQALVSAPGRVPAGALAGSVSNSQVPSVLPSSTTTISCGTLCSRSSRCRCSTVEQMQPSSLRAGMTTESSDSGRGDWVQAGFMRRWRGPASRGVARHARQSPRGCAPGKASGRQFHSRSGAGGVQHEPGHVVGARRPVSAPTGCGPNRLAHQSLNCGEGHRVVDAAAHVQRLAQVCRGCRIWRPTGTARSRGWRQSRTWWPCPPKPMYFSGRRWR